MVFLETSGGPRERGRQHGEQLRDEVAECLAGHGLPAGLSEAGRQLDAWLRQTHPAVGEELEGLAEGAAQPYERIFLNTVHNALAHLETGCTTFVARGEDGGCVLGKTQDVGDWEAAWQLVQTVTDAAGRRRVVVGLVGAVWGVCGMTEDGLCAGINSAPSLAEASPPAGLPQHLALCPVLERDATVDGALRWWLRTPLVGKGINGCLCDGVGNAASFERCNRRYVVQQSSGSLHLENHYRDPGLNGLARRDAGASSFSREAFLNSRLTGRLFANPAAEARALLETAPPAVAQPINAQGIGTRSAYLADPAAGTFAVTDGPPATTPWRVISLR